MSPRSSGFRGTLVVAGFTFRQAFHERLLTTLGLFGLVVVGGTPLIARLTLGERVRIIKGFGLGATLFLGFLIAALWGVRALSGEIESRRIVPFLARPLGRSSYLTGRFLGLSLLLLFNTVVMGVVVGGAVWAVRQPVHLPLLGAAILSLWVELEVLAGAALFASTLLTPWVSVLCVLVTFTVGHLGRDLEIFGVMTKSPAVRWATWGLHQVFPDFSMMSFRRDYTYLLPIDSLRLSLSVVHGAAYATALVCLAALVFHRRDLR